MSSWSSLSSCLRGLCRASRPQVRSFRQSTRSSAACRPSGRAARAFLPSLKAGRKPLRSGQRNCQSQRCAEQPAESLVHGTSHRKPPSIRVGIVGYVATCTHGMCKLAAPSGVRPQAALGLLQIELLFFHTAHFLQVLQVFAPLVLAERPGFRTAPTSRKRSQGNRRSHKQHNWSHHVCLHPWVQHA